MSNKFYKIIVTSLLLTLTTALSACSKEEVNNIETKAISTKELQSKLDDNSWVIVDTRINDAYNGWKLDGVKRGGHIEGAVDFSSNWLDVDNKDKEKILDEALQTKKIDKDKNIVLYDANGKDSEKVATYLSSKGYKNIYTYDVKEWANDDSLPMKQYDNYEMIVPAVVVKDLLDGKTPETFDKNKKVKIVEASWGEEKETYLKGHVPTAVHINTDSIEPPPSWMLDSDENLKKFALDYGFTKNDKETYLKGHVPTAVHINTDSIEPPPSWMLDSDENLKKFALDYGFTKNDSVIVTGKDPMASYRIAVVLRYIGIEDVRVLNGGNDAWKRAGYELETKSNAKTTG